MASGFMGWLFVWVQSVIFPFIESADTCFLFLLSFSIYLSLSITLPREEALPVQKENEQPQKAASKKSRKPIKEMEFITVLEFDSIPPYVPLTLPLLPITA